MTNFFAKRDRFGHGNALWIVLLLVFLATPAIWSLSRIDLENDIANWLPEDDPQARTLRWYRSTSSTRIACWSLGIRARCQTPE